MKSLKVHYKNFKNFRLTFRSGTHGESFTGQTNHSFMNTLYPQE